MKTIFSTVFTILLWHSHLLGIGNDVAQQYPRSEVVTHPLRTDGFGAQFQSIITSVIYAEFHNQKYLYTPFISMEHNYDNEADFIKKKEWLINFIGNFEINNDLNLQFNSVPTTFKFFDENPIKCMNSSSLKKIKEIFRANKVESDYFQKGYLNIAVHVRRYNPHDTRIEGPNIPDDVYLKHIDFLRKKYSMNNALFHIYSQGNIQDLEKIFNSNDIVLHINDSVEQAFTSMVLADVLVTSASSFSYVAGFLSDGTVYYIPFWHPPLPDWIVLNY